MSSTMSEIKATPSKNIFRNKPPSDEGGGFRRRRKTKGEIYKKRATVRVAPTKFCGDANENTVGADIIRPQNKKKKIPLFRAGFF